MSPETRIALASGKKSVLVVPTWQRGQPTFLLETAFIERLKIVAAREDINFFIKLHPLYHNPERNITNSRGGLFTISPGVDIYPHLTKFDLLLTDYSSIMFDFLLTDKPVLSLDIAPGTHQNFEPDYSLVPAVPFRHLFTPYNFEAQLLSVLSIDDKVSERRQMVSEIFETDPTRASEDLFVTIDRLVDEAVSVRPQIIYPAR